MYARSRRTSTGSTAISTFWELIGTVCFKGYQEPDDRAKIDFESQKERVTEWCESLPAAATVGA